MNLAIRALAIPRHLIRQRCRSSLLSVGCTYARGQVRLSTLRYLSKLAVLRHANLSSSRFASTNPEAVNSRHTMPTSFNCQRPFPESRAIGNLRSRRSAAAFWSRRCENKKPGVERRACPSIRFGRVLVAQPPERKCSKLVLQKPGVRNQPHLEVSRRARSVRGLPDKSGLHQHQESIAVSCISSSVSGEKFMA